MAPRSRPSSGFFGVQECPFSRFAAEITADGVRWWIGTFDSAELAARAYDAAAIRFGRPRRDLNFPDIGRDCALWLAPPLHFVDVTDGHEQRRQQRHERANLRGAQIDGIRMETLCCDHPELVQAELDFFAGRKKKKAAAARADGAGPSAPPPPPPNRIDVGSSSSELGSSFWDTTDDDSDSAAAVLD
ncbi:hypothetical protein D1007_59855 [Hordeum vulgare]|nr:hypothetical protein D1007_59855 [Hordeum vulgare]